MQKKEATFKTSKLSMLFELVETLNSNNMLYVYGILRVTSSFISQVF